MSEEKPRTRRERISLLYRFRHLEEAERHKLIRYAWSGLLIIFFGLILLGLGLTQYLNTGTAYSSAGLLIGFGAIIVLVGIIRILIGLINPWSPTDLTPPKPPTEDLDRALELEGE
ncbi:MAG TPA: hypothetical protein VKR06_05415 [Ktedonosporobacter sp.]|nr:hypothetical protein [Ktedonosporobacter sp.]